jgi:hypothetical protein
MDLNNGGKMSKFYRELENLYSVINIADNAVGDLKNRISANSSWFTTLCQYEKTVKKARESWNIIRKELGE